MPIQIEGFAIVSEDGMVADANGVMPSGLIVEADQKFLSDKLDDADFLVHGRHSHEYQPLSGKRRRLIASRTIEAIERSDEHPNALLWNPAGLCLEEAADRLGISQGKAAILGGPEIYRLFLPRYDVFHLSRVDALTLTGGRSLFHDAGTSSPEEALRASGLIDIEREHLDEEGRVTLTTWYRQSIGHGSPPSSRPRSTA
jgi:dihydrofolate reductase